MPLVARCQRKILIAIAADEPMHKACFDQSDVFAFLADPYAVMSFGGFLGLGESYHPLPWKVLTYDTRLEGYVIDLDRERLKNAPRYGVGEEPFADPAFGQRLGDYYGAR